MSQISPLGDTHVRLGKIAVFAGMEFIRGFEGEVPCADCIGRISADMKQEQAGRRPRHIQLKVQQTGYRVGD